MRRFLVLLLATSAFAAGVRYDNQAVNFRGLPAAGANIRICAAGATGTPCNPLVTIYSDHGLLSSKSNPFTADSLGNYSFFAPAGEYQIQISGTGIITSTRDYVPLAPVTGGGGGGGGTSTTRFAWFEAAGCGGSSSSLALDILPSGGMTSVCATGSNVSKGMGRFPNTGTPSGQASILLSGLSTTSTDIVLVWTTSVSSGTATWQLGAVCTPTDGSATDDPAFLNYWNPTISTASGTPNTLNSISVSAVGLPGSCANGLLLHLRIKRIDTTGTATNADLVGFGITFH
jgi:hypothetical protein